MAEPSERPLAVAPDRPRRLVYLGTPDVAVPPLGALHAAGFEVPLVVTRPDTRRGRGSASAPSPVKEAARELGIEVDHDLARVADVGADLAVVVAYGRIIPRAVLEQLPMVNLHFSLLPRWRGAAPVERALLAGDARTGVCLMEVAEGLDTGGVYAMAETPISADDTLATLRSRLVVMGTELLISRLTTSLGRPVPQEGEVTHAAKIDPAEYRIDWSRPAVELDRLVRLGGAHTSWRGKRLKVWSARPVGPAVPDALDGFVPGAVVGGTGAGDAGLLVAAGDGGLEILEVQPEGKARQPVADWRNGARPAVGDRFGA
ncbi:MAG: methionyl-tRNA formyltransferase [Acidimicrobiales bacterium]|nr:methionyl-tRNA formyltransferase [Acidimicrobiales bacterium]